MAAALVAASQILGGVLAPKIAALTKKRTSSIIGLTVISSVVLVLLGATNNFWFALVLVAVWGLSFAAVMPVRQAYLNGMIPSKQRATVLSFDSLMGNSGGIVFQPALGKAADIYSYGTSLVIGGLLQLLALPFQVASRTKNHSADIR